MPVLSGSGLDGRRRAPGLGLAFAAIVLVVDLAIAQLWGMGACGENVEPGTTRAAVCALQPAWAVVGLLVMPLALIAVTGAASRRSVVAAGCSCLLLSGVAVAGLAIVVS